MGQRQRLLARLADAVLDQVAVFDARPANFPKDGQGVVLPIDGVVVECGDAPAAQVENLLRAAASD